MNRWRTWRFKPAYGLPYFLPPLAETIHSAAWVDPGKRVGLQGLRATRPLGLDEDIAALKLDEWSERLAGPLDRPHKTLRTDLFHLYESYRFRDVEHCLRLIETFPCFPGYPDMVSGSFLQHMEFVSTYLESSASRRPAIRSVPFIAFRKTASAYIAVAVSRLLSVPVTAVSYQHQIGMRAWLASFARFGGITHDHFEPTAANLSLLREAGLRQVVVHGRHPVQAMISLAFHAVRLDQVRPLSRAENTVLVRAWLDRYLERTMRHYADWWQAWRREAREGRMDILLTRYEEMVDQPLAFFRRLLGFYGAGTVSDAEIERSLRDTGEQNFRRADPEEWKDILTPAQIDRFKRLTAEEEAFEDYASWPPISAIHVSRDRSTLP